MHKNNLYFISIKKEFLDFLYNKVSILLFIMASCFLIFMNQIPILNNKIEVNPSKLYILLDFIICIFFITQYLYDGFKKDCSTGGVIFLLNCNVPCNIYLLGKKIVSFLFIILFISLRIKDFLSFFSLIDYFWIFLFFVFIVNNTFLFSILFYSPNMNLIAYVLIYVIPVFLLVLFMSFKLNILKILILVFVNLFIKKKTITAWYSRRFRIPLKTV